MKLNSLLAVLCLGSLATPVQAQTTAPNPTQQGVSESREPVPLFKVSVVARTTPTINYRHRSGATTIDLEGTPLLPRSHGEAKVESKQGYIEIEVEFDELESATRFGPEYLTYVMWAITPEGRATNLGEILLNGSESKLNVTSELQMFGLIVTAEPYFAVSQPSDVVVMENRVRESTRGSVELIEARYELLKRGTYTMNADPRRAHGAAETMTTIRRSSCWRPAMRCCCRDLPAPTDTPAARSRRRSGCWWTQRSRTTRTAASARWRAWRARRSSAPRTPG